MHHNYLIPGSLTLLGSDLQLLKHQGRTKMLVPLNAKKCANNVGFKPTHSKIFSKCQGHKFSKIVWEIWSIFKEFKAYNKWKSFKGIFFFLSVWLIRITHAFIRWGLLLFGNLRMFSFPECVFSWRGGGSRGFISVYKTVAAA